MFGAQLNIKEVFIAGGAGVTPFIAILRQLQADDKIANNKLILHQ
jgi:ferredoxin-NADP reductase